MINPIKQIYQFNKDADLLKAGYDDARECSFLIEEALEGFSNLDDTPKNISRGIIKLAGTFEGSDVDRLDKACDAVVFAVGSMAKLGLNPNQITRALNVVMQANIAKLGCPKDEFGKLTKDANFVGPEEKLQKILDERSV